MNQRLKDNQTDDLFKAILSLKDLNECYNFFEDLLTINELKSFAQRLAVAKLLNEGKTYEEIISKTGASTATISRVKKFLEYGSEGYQLVIKRINNT
jgi:TrpR-related protein YerC/YecD